MEKSNIKKKILKTIVSLVIVTSLIVSSIIPSYALKWNGDSSIGGGGTGATENGFAVPSTNNNECCVGYRFSVVNNNGDLRANLVIDIFKNTSLGNDAFNYYYKCTKKYNKIEIIQRNYLDFESVPTQYNCFMEQNMGFVLELPNPDGLEFWQSINDNLNPILRTAFDNDRANIGTLVNGDKILVEPLFAVKLEQQYHALTVTEIAIYGAKTLGYDSDGGSPSTGANGKYLSFISNKTNREFANMLHIPYDLNDNGNQKIWTGAITLTNRDSFYNIINSAYGVGYAYTETKASDFVPNLKVKKVDVRKGKALETHEQLGTSFGNTFEEYGFDDAWGTGEYPTLNQKMWLQVKFEKEKEKVNLKHTVWIDNVPYTGDVYGYLSPIDIPYNYITEDKTEIIISARVDWIDKNNNVLKYGEKKDFCIPIKPKINRYQVGMYDDEGVLRATNGTDGQHGNLYVGQETRAKYTFTSENTWTSTNLLRGRAYEWKANSWQPSNAIGCNVSTDDANINKSAPYLMISPYENGLESFTVPDNTGNTEVINRVPFLLSSYWAKSPNHTKEETWIDIPVEKGNVAITDIQILHYLDHTRSELLGQGSTLFVGEEYAKFYTFKNYCNSPMKIEVWENTKQIEKAVFY